MTTYPLCTREGVEEHVAGIFSAAKEVIEKGGKLLPQAVIYSRRDPKLGINIYEPVPVSVPFDRNVTRFDEDARGRYTTVLRHAARELNAVGVVTVFESRFHFKDPVTGEAAGDWSDVVLAVLDHEDLGEVLWVARIDRDKRIHVGRHRTLLELARESNPDARIGRVVPKGSIGAFARMLPAKWMD